MMKRIILWLFVFASQVLCSGILCQTLYKADLVEQLVTVKDSVGEERYLVSEYVIECEFAKNDTDKINKDIVLKSDNWKVYDGEKLLPIGRIIWTPVTPELVDLIGPFKGHDKLAVQFLGYKAVLVNIDSSIANKTKWGFGKGKAVDFNIRRLAKPKALLAFDYDFKIKILEHNLAIPKGSVWLRSLSFNLNSEGTIGSDDEVRNGTQSSLEAALNPYYFCGGLIYRGAFYISYQIETRMNSADNRMFDIINKRLKFGIEAELPYTNYLMYKLHTKTGYVRLAMPLTLSLDYLPQKNKGNDYNSLARLDLKARYELAFSPYIILRGEYYLSRFFNEPADINKNNSFYSLTIAQDLDVLKETIGFLKSLFSSSKQIRGKHFVFYKFSVGRKAPAFQDVKEQSVGFGSYF